MYNIFLGVCLIIALLTLEIFVVSGFHTGGHRLLPLILGLIALYDFYLIVQYNTGNDDVFYVLKELLLIQLLDLVAYYIIDFMRIRLKMYHHVLLVAILIAFDIVIIMKAREPGSFHRHVLGFSAVTAIIIVTMVAVTSKRKIMSRQTRRNNEVLFFALFVPAFTLVVSTFDIWDAGVALPIALTITCLILDYLFIVDRLRDVDSVLKEEHFQMLDFPALLFDKDFYFMDASKRAWELFGETLGKMKAAPDNYEGQDQLKKLLDEGGSRVQSVDGVYYRITITEAYYKGKMRGYILSFMDVTEQMNETNVAKEIAKQKSEFLASMSHDLRSPLHAIIGSSEIALSRIEMTERTRVIVNNIHEAGNNLLDIVNSILDFSKLESGMLELHPRKYNVRKMLIEQAQLGFVAVKDMPVKYKLEVVDEFPDYFVGDEMRVRQIFQNLIGNAVKFTEKGSVECRVSFLKEKDACMRLILEVKDSGPGMTKEQCEAVFDDYVSYAQEHKKEGTGLGLSIVNRLCKMMDGFVSVESTVGVGTTFHVEILQEIYTEGQNQAANGKRKYIQPFIIEDESQLGDVQVWRNTVIPTYVYPEAKVLVVDDMAVNRDLFRGIVAPWQFQVDSAVNGKEAVERVKNNHYDLIFLDQMMPVMTGIEAADEIKKLTDTPLILLTANITEYMQKKSEEHGFVEFLQKPIDFSLIKKYIEKYLPIELRRAFSDNRYHMNYAVEHDKSYEKALSTYVKEMKELYEKLPGYVENDFAMFKNKVHGIKGISRQLGKDHIALLAEIMEMAAITKNQDFIEKYADIFYSDLKIIIAECEQELNFLQMKERGSSSEAEKRKVDGEVLGKLFEELKNALEEYDVDAIEQAINQIGGVWLEEAYANAMEQIKDYFEELEYEECLKIVEGLSF